MRCRNFRLIFHWLILMCGVLFLASCGERNKNIADVCATKNLKCYYFFIPDCPACRSNFKPLMQLQNQYPKNIFSVEMVLSDPLPDTEVLQETIRKYGLPNSVLMDTSLAFAKSFSVTTTPQCILLDSCSNVIYSGAFDNTYYKFGKMRASSSENYLADAVSAALKGKKPKVTRTEPIGCKINFEY